MTTAIVDRTLLGPICYRCKEDFMEVVTTFSNVLQVHVHETKLIGDKLAIFGTARMEMCCGTCRFRIPVTTEIELEALSE